VAKISCLELSKQFDNQVVLSDINLDLEFSGLGLLGSNGSGKTTLLNLLLEIIKPSLGSIDIDVPREKIRVVQDQPVLPWKMTRVRWLYTLENFYGPNIMNIDIQSDFGLEGHWKLQNLSAGQKRKASMLSVFYGKPELIVIDEPSNYLDITSREYVMKLLKQFIDYSGAAIIIASHNIDELRLFSSHVMLMEKGRIANVISLHQEKPTYFALKATNINLLADELSDKGILFFMDETINGKIIKVEASDDLWMVLSKIKKLGEDVLHFRTIDSLERMVEDLHEE